jgi:hypothetical protein
LNRITHILLLIVLMAPFAYKTYLITHYFVLQDYYATELCENKNDSSKNCNGLCQLSKELSNTTTESEQNTPINLQELNISSFILPDNFFWNLVNFELSKEDATSKVCFYHKDFENKRLKPPKSSC